jgi:hypothetical protein
MRVWPLIALTLAGLLSASEQAYPLWDGHESVADYAKHLSPTKTRDCGNGVKLERVLIPAGKFIMGTPKPTEPPKPTESMVPPEPPTGGRRWLPK